MEAAFSVFHYAGSWGASEAYCESLGAILKRSLKSRTTSRAVRTSILRASGVRGVGGEDEFIQ
eukprot:3476467-Lingulodinium_polyedra.AAC.1